MVNFTLTNQIYLKRHTNPPNDHDKREAAKMRLFFFYMWQKSNKLSEVSGRWLGTKYSTTFMHHILGKKAHAKLKYLPNNIVYLTSDEHTQVEAHPNCFPSVNERREDLMKNYKKYSNIAKKFEKEVLDPLVEAAKGRLW